MITDSISRGDRKPIVSSSGNSPPISAYLTKQTATFYATRRILRKKCPVRHKKLD